MISIKGPGHRLNYDIRRRWVCPHCGREIRTPGTVTARLCPSDQTWMKLVEKPRSGQLARLAHSPIEDSITSSRTKGELLPPDSAGRESDAMQMAEPSPVSVTASGGQSESIISPPGETLTTEPTSLPDNENEGGQSALSPPIVSPSEIADSSAGVAQAESPETRASQTQAEERGPHGRKKSADKRRRRSRNRRHRRK